VLRPTRTVLRIALVLALTGSRTALPRFPAFVDAYFDSLYAYAPSAGTAAGFHQYDSIIENRSASSIARRVATLAWQRVRLDSLRAATLVTDD
jgi:hypothetical protein